MSPQRPEKKKTVITIQKAFPSESDIFLGDGGETMGWRLGEPLYEFGVFLLRVGIHLVCVLRESVVRYCLDCRKVVSPSHPIVLVAA